MTAAPRGLLRRGKRFWWLVAITTLPATTLVAINLLLASPPACRWAASKIEAHSGLPTHIGGLSIWPWSGIGIRNLEIQLPKKSNTNPPDALLHVRSIRIQTEWLPLRKRQVVIRDVIIEGAELHLPLEAIAALIPSPPPPPTTALAVNTPSQKPHPGTAPSPSAPTTPTTPATPPAIPTTSAPQPPAITDSRPSAWCHVRDATLIIHAGQGSRRLEIHQVSGDIPFRGPNASGSLSIGKLLCDQTQMLGEQNFHLQWQYPALRLEPLELPLADATLQIAAAVIPRQALPIEIHAACKPQPWQSPRLPYDLQIHADTLTARADFVGLLTQPASWQAQGLCQMRGIRIDHPDHHVRFDHGQAILLLHSGQIQCPDLRMIGEEMSLLANGRAQLAQGRWAATLRLVAAPESLQQWGATLLPKAPQPLPLTPLSTPQRAAFDLEARGDLKQFSLHLGQTQTATPSPSPPSHP